MAIFDKKLVLPHFSGNEELFMKVVRKFIECYPRMLEEIRSAINNNDPLKLRESAHSFKGSVSIFRVKVLTDKVFELEKMGEVGNIVDAGPRLDEIEKELIQLVSEMTNL